MPTLEIVTWKIIGIRPLIQSNPHEMWKDPVVDEDTLATTNRSKKKLVGTDSENFIKAKAQLYVNEEGLYYHPAMSFWFALLKACKLRQIGRVDAQNVVVQSVAQLEDQFILYDPATLGSKKPKPMTGDEWQIDLRRGINANKNKTSGGVAVVCVRPKWKQWGGFLSFEVDRDIIKTDEGLAVLTELLNIGGHHFGVGVGRMRVKGEKKQREVWGGLGTGKFTAELKK